MNASVLESIVSERSARWAVSGIAWQVDSEPATSNPAAWLTLRSGKADAFLKVWATGEAEMDWGGQGDAHARHYELTTVEDLSTCVDDLEEALGASR